MYTVNTKDEDVYLMNIYPVNLKHILEWYNKHEFKYATGIEGNVSLHQLVALYNKVQQSQDHFWIGIFVLPLSNEVKEVKLSGARCPEDFISSTGEMIGVLRGQIKFGSEVSVWINTIIIDQAFQSKGYGTKIVNLLINYTKLKSNISAVYMAVAECNTRGRKFWSSLGFKQYGRIANCIKFGGEANNAIIMYKSC